MDTWRPGASRSNGGMRERMNRDVLEMRSVGMKMIIQNTLT